MLHHRKSDYKFSIYRILGNDLPPRDEPESRYNILQFMLDNEFQSQDVHKGWIINCVHDIPYRNKICELLKKYNQHFVVLPMDRPAYDKGNRDQKILQAIPINKARNIAIRFGQRISDYTVILDGDCYFDKITWDIISDFILKDKPGKKYYSIPHTRSTLEHVKTNNTPVGDLGEPMLVFRKDAEWKFDENIVFGNGDKLNLLFKLGHQSGVGRTRFLKNEDHTKVIGYVHHLATGKEEVETNLQHRIEQRNKSIDILLKKLNDPQESFKLLTPGSHPRKPNECWKQIQGWFDYRAIYSHLAFDLPTNSTMVEVGSWLGASIVYFAQEVINRDKKMQIYAVDTWAGSNEFQHEQLIKNMQSKGTDLFETFKRNLNSCGVANVVTPIQKPSIEASEQFADESIDFVFIDAGHSYEDVKADIRSWYPKVKNGGFIGGHDYVPGHPASDIGVIRAVNEFFKNKNLEIRVNGRCWLHQKI